VTSRTNATVCAGLRLRHMKIKKLATRPIASLSLDQLRRIAGGWVAYTDDGKTLASCPPSGVGR
jgi:hypothetical protein